MAAVDRSVDAIEFPGVGAVAAGPDGKVWEVTIDDIGQSSKHVYVIAGDFEEAYAINEAARRAIMDDPRGVGASSGELIDAPWRREHAYRAPGLVEAVAAYGTARRITG